MYNSLTINSGVETFESSNITGLLRYHKTGRKLDMCILPIG